MTSTRLRIRRLSLHIGFAFLFHSVMASFVWCLETPEIELVGPHLGIELPSEQRLEELMQTIGLHQSGPPIRLQIVSRDSPEALRAPSWAAGYALPNAGRVVVIRDRIPTYPDSHLQQVVVHEIAHVLISRAAQRRPLPRWFNEGLAVVASREWQFADRARTMFAGWTVDLESIDQNFLEGARRAAAAYAVSASFVHHLLEIHGPSLPGRIFAKMRRGMSFEAAFEQATGNSLADQTMQYDRSLDWTRWIPLVSSSAILWIGITALALVAFVRRRQRDEALRQLWIDEEFDPTIN